VVLAGVPVAETVAVAGPGALELVMELVVVVVALRIREAPEVLDSAA
jgi:hypothetical protein